MSLTIRNYCLMKLGIEASIISKNKKIRKLVDIVQKQYAYKPPKKYGPKFKEGLVQTTDMTVHLKLNTVELLGSLFEKRGIGFIKRLKFEIYFWVLLKRTKLVIS